MVEYPLSLDDLPDDDDWCDQCGAELPLDPLYGRRRFCSIACQRDWHKEQEQREREAERAGRTCDQCGGAIDPRLRDGTRFCSRRCLYRWHNERDQRELRERRAGRPCWECGKPIPAELQVNVRYCSERCRKHVRAREMRERRRHDPTVGRAAQAERVERIKRERRAAKAGRTCEVCQAPIPVEKRGDAVTCSRQCKERRRKIRCRRYTPA